MARIADVVSGDSKHSSGGCKIIFHSQDRFQLIAEAPWRDGEETHRSKSKASFVTVLKSCFRY